MGVTRISLDLMWAAHGIQQGYSEVSNLHKWLILTTGTFEESNILIEEPERKGCQGALKQTLGPKRMQALPLHSRCQKYLESLTRNPYTHELACWAWTASRGMKKKHAKCLCRPSLPVETYFLSPYIHAQEVKGTWHKLAKSNPWIALPTLNLYNSFLAPPRALGGLRLGRGGACKRVRMSSAHVGHCSSFHFIFHYPYRPL